MAKRDLIVSDTCDRLVDAIEALIDEKLRDYHGDSPYWSGQVYEARKKVREALGELLGVNQ